MKIAKSDNNIFDINSIEYKAFNTLYENGKRFADMGKLLFTRKGVINGIKLSYTFEAYRKRMY